ncbi:MAG: ABC transporter ATP-binding protein [Thermosynechococcaceae cyanobacterium MS004]|nr:ABC transporter ATP-binding protein [Thermosynechococcaceae cyanobacterium MS004]
MSETVIRVENLGKKYIIGHQQEGQARYKSLREVIVNGAQSISKLNPFQGKEGNGSHPEREEFWALEDVSFEIKRGDRVGIIGRNGAGKSTLLKILSRITEPTEGEIKIRGRVASLLEVGTGFHPELTGRENVYLNGAILGMSREEIKRKFDAIVSFAEVEKFLDTPVKRYSSGMYVRLAFAVAAHLEPEVLIVDEVLAVGDAQFQKKCLGKMEDVGKEGRTVLFVSHNIGAIKALCNSGIFLSKGRLVTNGSIDSVVDQYVLTGSKPESVREKILSKCKRFELKLPYWIDNNGNKVDIYSFGENYKLRFEFNFFKPVKRINPGFAIIDYLGQRIFTSHLLDDKNIRFNKTLLGEVIVETDLNLSSLAPGNYSVIFGVRDENELTTIYSEGEINLEIGSSQSKNGAQGILWHTTDWKVKTLV